MSILILAGELSADRYGAQLVRSIKKKDPSQTIISAGGPELQSESDQFIIDVTHYSAVGIQAFIQNYFVFKAFYQKLKETISTQTISKAIIIDFQHHNFKIATYLKAHNIPIITYITPNFWLYRHEKNMRKLASYSQKIICIFQKEAELYQRFHQQVYYVGHPLLSISGIQAKTVSNSIQTIGIMPGSRSQELDLYLDAMLNTIKQYKKIAPQTRFLFLPSSDAFKKQVLDVCDRDLKSSIEVWDGSKASFFAQIDLLLVASGSSTLEAVLNNVPMIVLCALTPFTYFVAKQILKLKMNFISLPNIVADKEIVPELVQSDISVENIIAEINAWSNSEIKMQRLKRYTDVQNEMSSGKDSFDYAADVVLSS